MNHAAPQTAARQLNQQPPLPWDEISLEKWGGWRWQLNKRLNTTADFGKFFQLSPEEIAGLDALGIFRVEITTDFASIIDPEDPNSPSWQKKSDLPAANISGLL